MFTDLALAVSSNACVGAQIIAPRANGNRSVSASASPKTLNIETSLVSSNATSSSFFGSSLTLSARQCKSVGKFSNPKTALRVFASSPPDQYTVELTKPIGLKFYKGADGGTYVDFVIPGENAEKTGLFKPGDKVIETSAVFGDEMWPAAEFGRTMYTIRQRSGILTMRMEKRDGVKIDRYTGTEAYLIERKAGNYGEAIRDKQIENYLKKQELKTQRTEEIEEALKLYKQSEFTEALVRFETVLELQPEPREKSVTLYNVACCYSKLGKIADGLVALEAALESGFDDYKTIRNDADLVNLRESEEFKPLINKYDEPFINENAIKAITSVFGIFGGKK